MEEPGGNPAGLEPGQPVPSVTRHLAIAGAALGLVLVMRGPASFVVAAAMIPYLIATRRSRSDRDLLLLTAGFVIGIFPLALWLGLSSASQGGRAPHFFRFAVTIATDNRAGHGAACYL